MKGRWLRIPYDGSHDTHEGDERWRVQWWKAERDDESGEVIDDELCSKTFPNVVAARRWAKGQLKRGAFDWGSCTIVHEIAQHDPDAPAAHLGQWVEVETDREEWP